MARPSALTRGIQGCAKARHLHRKHRGFPREQGLSGKRAEGDKPPYHYLTSVFQHSSHKMPMKHSETVKENLTLLHAARWGLPTINFFKAHSGDVCWGSEEIANLQVNQKDDQIKLWHRNSCWLFFLTYPLKHRYIVMKRTLLFLQRQALKN